MSDRDELRDLDPGTGGTQNPFNPLVGDSTGDSGNNAGDGTVDGNNDYDGDTWRNIVELRDGTNPLDPPASCCIPCPTSPWARLKKSPLWAPPTMARITC